MVILDNMVCGHCEHVMKDIGFNRKHKIRIYKCETCEYIMFIEFDMSRFMPLGKLKMFTYEGKEI